MFFIRHLIIMKHHFFLIALFLSGCLHPALSQTIDGIITDSNNSPLPYANIILLSLPDSTYVQGTVSQEDGRFHLDGSSDKRLLRISFMGYETLFLPCKPHMDSIVLRKSTGLLEEVTIKAALPRYKLTSEGIQTQVEGTALEKAGTTEDILKLVPGVTKKGEDYEVFGKGKPIVYVNGRKINNIEELNMLQSSDVKHIEVIRNPGSEYDASVKAVIRIKTKKIKGEGWGINVKTEYDQEHYANANAQLDLSYHHNGLYLFGTYKYNNRGWYVNNSDFQSIHGDTLWEQSASGLYSLRRAYQHIGTGISYDFNPNHSVGIRYDNTNTLFLHQSKMSYISCTYADKALYDVLSSTSSTNFSIRPTHQVNTYYTGTVGQFHINLNADYFTNSSSEEQTSDEKSQKYENGSVCSRSYSKNQMFAVKLVADHPLGKGKMKWGVEHIISTNDNDYQISGVSVLTNTMDELKETTTSPFVAFDYPLPFGTLSTGARYEHVAFTYYKNHTRIGEQSRTYDNVYPNISLSFPVGKVMTQLSYTAKTVRPNYSQLSSNVSYANRYTMQTGNPNLKNETDHIVSWDGAWKFLQFSASYTDARQAIIYWSDLNPIQESALLIKYQNINSLKKAVAYAAVQPTWGIWSPTVTLAVSKQWLTVQGNAGKVNLDTPLFQFSWNNTLNLPHNWTLFTESSYTSKGNYENACFQRDNWNIGASIVKSWHNDDFSIKLSGNDFLQKNQSIKLYCPSIVVSQMQRNTSRGFTLTFRYKFNNGKNHYKGTGAGTEEIGRFTSSAGK